MRCNGEPNSRSAGVGRLFASKLNGGLNLRCVGHVKRQVRDALIWVGKWPAVAGIHPIRASPQGLLDERSADAAS